MDQHPITQRQVEEFVDLLRTGARPADAKSLVDLIAGLEEVKSAACAVQVVAAAEFDAVRRVEQAAAGVPAHRQARGIACLDAEHRTAIDETLCADPARLAGAGTRELISRIKTLAARLDPAALARRASKAETDRNVTLRPAPDTMTYLTALLPVAQGVAVYAALTSSADQARAAGDARGKGQLMADLLYARTTGQELTDDTQPPAVPVAVNITLPDSALAGGHDPAVVSGPGVTGEVVPAETARLLIGRSIEAGVAAWFRQLYANPKGRLVAMTSKQRHFPAALADFLAIRGLGICATAWCDAPVRHADHIRPVSERGPTTEANGQGLCEACNHAKQAPGWQQHVTSPPNHPQQVETITPTGHRYRTTAPPPPGWRDSA